MNYSPGRETKVWRKMCPRKRQRTPAVYNISISDFDFDDAVRSGCNVAVGELVLRPGWTGSAAWCQTSYNTSKILESSLNGILPRTQKTAFEERFGQFASIPRILSLQDELLDNLAEIIFKTNNKNSVLGTWSWSPCLGNTWTLVESNGIAMHVLLGPN